MTACLQIQMQQIRMHLQQVRMESQLIQMEAQQIQTVSSFHSNMYVYGNGQVQTLYMETS